MRRSRLAAAGTVVLVWVLAGCGAEPSSQPTEPSDLVVLAAASLTDTFTELGEQFEAANPDTRVTFSFAGSSQLAQQIVSGAPADVFASASPATMTTVTDEDLTAAPPDVFARNVIVMAVPAGNPGDVQGLADLADEDLVVAFCQVEVPCGAAAADVMEAAGVQASPDTLEQDVRGVLSKLELREVDAGLVYRTDVLGSGDSVEGIEVDGAEQAANDYLVAPLAASEAPELAAAFVELVLSAEGQDLLTDAGFEAG